VCDAIVSRNRAFFPTDNRKSAWESWLFSKLRKSMVLMLLFSFPPINAIYFFSKGIVSRDWWGPLMVWLNKRKNSNISGSRLFVIFTFVFIKKLLKMPSVRPGFVPKAEFSRSNVFRGVFRQGASSLAAFLSWIFRRASFSQFFSAPAEISPRRSHLPRHWRSRILVPRRRKLLCVKSFSWEKFRAKTHPDGRHF
jgi:hypothetical protein